MAFSSGVYKTRGREGARFLAGTLGNILIRNSEEKKKEPLKKENKDLGSKSFTTDNMSARSNTSRTLHGRREKGCHTH